MIYEAASDTYEYKIEHMFDWGWAAMDAQLFSSLFVMLLVLVFAILIGALARSGYKKKTYLQRPHGLLFFGEMYYGICDNFVATRMGYTRRGYTGYFMCLFAYLFLAFIWGITGAPSVIDWLAAPLTLSIIMFALIQYNAIKTNHWHYFHRYIEPFAIFLPINLLTMWTPILSTAMRMFGNALSGTIIIGLVQWALGNASSAILSSLSTSGWTSIFLAPIPMGILNIYFSLFSGFVQTLVFATLSALWIAQEMPAEEDPALSEAPRAVVENKEA
jgi:F-type H+-transporting ATPase subunit a